MSSILQSQIIYLTSTKEEGLLPSIFQSFKQCYFLNQERLLSCHLLCPEQLWNHLLQKKASYKPSLSSKDLTVSVAQMDYTEKSKNPYKLSIMTSIVITSTNNNLADIITPITIFTARVPSSVRLSR